MRQALRGRAMEAQSEMPPVRRRTFPRRSRRAPARASQHPLKLKAQTSRRVASEIASQFSPINRLPASVGPGWDTNQFAKVASRELYFSYKTRRRQWKKALGGQQKSNNNPAAHHSILQGRPHRQIFAIQPSTKLAPLTYDAVRTPAATHPPQCKQRESCRRAR